MGRQRQDFNVKFYSLKKKIDFDDDEITNLVSKFSGQYRFLTTYSDEEQRFMYKINQGRLTVFCIVFV